MTEHLIHNFLTSIIEKSNMIRSLNNLNNQIKSYYIDREIHEHFLFHSNAIESDTDSRGKTVPKEPSIYSPMTVEPKIRYDISNLLKMYKLFKTLGITKDTIQLNHKIMMKGIINEPGHFRKIDVEIKGACFQPPRHDQLPILIDELIHFITINPYKLEPLELATYFHYHFLRIHPFEDGNGRMARIILNHILHDNGLSTRCVAKAIFYLLKVKRSHVSIWKWIQKCHPRKISSKRKKIDEYIVDETLIRVGSELVWLWVAIEPQNRQILALSNSKERNMFVAERCLSGLVKVHGKHPVSTDGGTWYPMACRFLKLNHHIHSSLEKSLIERTMQYIKDRTESFDDYFPCRKENCKLKHVRNWLNLFVNYHNKEVSYA